MIVIGLTGSIGMGKSTVAKMFEDRGIPVHDADATVHHLLRAGGAGVDLVGAQFPDALSKDEQGRNYIDRKALGRAVFGNAEAKKKLEDILHPMVRAESDRFKTAMRLAKKDMIVLDIPLLFETKGEGRVDVIVTVSAPEDIQRARVLARPNMTPERFESIKAAQMPDAEKRKRSNAVIDTGVSLDETRAQVDRFVTDLKKDKKCAPGFRP